jgi:hypothetical protein
VKRAWPKWLWKAFLGIGICGLFSGVLNLWPPHPHLLDGITQIIPGAAFTIVGLLEWYEQSGRSRLGR